MTSKLLNKCSTYFKFHNQISLSSKRFCSINAWLTQKGERLQVSIPAFVYYVMQYFPIWNNNHFCCVFAKHSDLNLYNKHYYHKQMLIN